MAEAPDFLLSNVNQESYLFDKNSISAKLQAAQYYNALNVESDSCNRSVFTQRNILEIFVHFCVSLRRKTFIDTFYATTSFHLATKKNSDVS